MTNGNDSAYPEIQTDLDLHNPTESGNTYSTGGLTKRELFAATIMSGFCGSSGTEWPDLDVYADKSVEAADELIKSLNKKPEGK